MDYEAVLEQIGGCGKFQLTAFGLLSVSIFRFAIDVESSVFYHFSPNFSCSDWNATDGYMPCKSSGSEGVACSQWSYDDSVVSHSVVTDFDLVCDRGYLVDVISSLVFAGSMIGMMIGGLADHFGRRNILLCLAAWDALFSVLMAALPGLETHMALSFLRGFSAWMYSLGLSYLFEFVSARHRAKLGSSYWIMFCLGYAVCAGLGKWLRHWRFIQAVASVCCVVYVPYYFLLPESPRWLMLNGKKKEAIRVFKRVAKVNGRQVDDKALYDINVQRHPNGRAVYMFKSKQMSIKTLTAWLTLWCSACSFVGMTLHVNLVDDFHLNLALVALIGLPSCPLAWKMSDKFGRRISFWITMLISAICFFIIPFLQQDNVQWIRLMFATIGMLASTAAYVIANIWLTENFPTGIRNFGVYSSNIWACTAFVLAPYILRTSSRVFWLPELIFGLQCVIAFISPFFLPETLASPLSQTVKEADLLRRGEENLFGERMKGFYIEQNVNEIPLTDEEEMSPYPILNDDPYPILNDDDDDDDNEVI